MSRKFIVRILLVVGPIGALIMTINYCVDPANIFSTDLYVKGIAEILAKGHNVDNISNCDERLLQEQTVRLFPSTPDLVILGSSRVMQVGTNFFQDKKVLNCGVSHANMKDIVAITGLLDSLKKFPAELILNLDPGLIAKDGTDEWQSLDGYYNFIIGQINNQERRNWSPSLFGMKKRFGSLLSPQYLQSSIQFLGKRKSKDYKDVGTGLPSTYGRLSDGTVFYAYDYMHPDTAAIAANAATEGKRGHFGEADAGLERLFEQWLTYIEKKGTRLTLCMVPYHPSLYAASGKFHDNELGKFRTYFEKTARARQLAITGSFDPADYDIKEAEFYDESHCSAVSLKKILIGK